MRLFSAKSKNFISQIFYTDSAIKRGKKSVGLFIYEKRIIYTIIYKVLTCYTISGKEYRPKKFE